MSRRTGGQAVRRSGGVAAAAAMMLALGSCTTLDKAVGAVPMFTTMRDQVAIRPFEDPTRLPPAGSVPTTGREDSLDLFAGDLAEVVNPVPATPGSLLRGQRIFDTYCAVCHGPRGAADGTVSGKFLGIVPALTTDQARGRTDGYLYAVLRYGRGAMPRYGDKIRDRTDRWNVVNYVRSFQAQ